jgi:hypothetical protein
MGKSCGGLVVDARVPGVRENGCLPDGVSGPQADPLWNGTILLLRFGKLLLGAEGFVALDVRGPVSEEQPVRREDEGKTERTLHRRYMDSGKTYRHLGDLDTMKSSGHAMVMEVECR